MSRTASRWIVAFALAFLVVTPAMAAGPISTEISMASPFLKGSQNVVVTFTMTNQSDSSVRVLRWNTPLDGIDADLFEVSRDGEQVPYLGRVIKRPPPQAEDFVVLAPGESISAAVELSAFYAMRYTGQYEVRFRTTSFDTVAAKGGRAELVDLGSAPIVFWIDGEAAPAADALERLAKARPGGGGSTCSNDQLATLASALNAARGIAANAAGYLAGAHNASSPRYNEWFGAYTSARWETADAHFQAISNALDSAPVEFDCKCKQNYYAYVYPTQPYKIYLCKVFWTAPLTGTDSKAGTLVHEISHFNVVAGTDDVTYGQTSCRNLADTNPAGALNNADSHEYFAENTPFLN